MLFVFGKTTSEALMFSSLGRWAQIPKLVNVHDGANVGLMRQLMLASPVQRGCLPWSYDRVWRMYQKAAKAAGIGGLGTHKLRHTFRTWLDSVGTPVNGYKWVSR
jgi:integrase